MLQTGPRKLCFMILVVAFLSDTPPRLKVIEEMHAHSQYCQYVHHAQLTAFASLIFVLQEWRQHPRSIAICHRVSGCHAWRWKVCLLVKRCKFEALWHIWTDGLCFTLSIRICNYIVIMNFQFSRVLTSKSNVAAFAVFIGSWFLLLNMRHSLTSTFTHFRFGPRSGNLKTAASHRTVVFQSDVPLGTISHSISDPVYVWTHPHFQKHSETCSQRHLL
jgi:hypothetical protein